MTGEDAVGQATDQLAMLLIKHRISLYPNGACGTIAGGGAKPDGWIAEMGGVLGPREYGDTPMQAVLNCLAEMQRGTA